MLIILILFCFISLLGTASAEDTYNNDLASTDAFIGINENNEISSVEEISVYEDVKNADVSADDSSLGTVNGSSSKNVLSANELSATYDLTGSTVQDIKELIESGNLQANDVIYLGNQDISSTWSQWTGDHIINVNVDNIIISGGSSDNPDGISTINANQARLFNIQASGVTLTNINFLNSQGGNGPGSAIAVGAPDCTITNCEFENCEFTNGGAIHASSDASNMVIDNCNFTSNYGRWGGHGGAVYSESSATISNSNFNGNHAENGNGAVYIAESATVTNCNFTDNYCSGQGGALTIGGDNAVVNNCNFNDNKANGYSQGGALELLGENPEVINSNFKGNSATLGGAVYIERAGATLTDCVFEDNTATFGGALNIYHDDSTITNCNFTSNEASSQGGAIYIGFDCHNAQMTECNFESNDAESGTAIFCDEDGDGKVTDCTFSVKPGLSVDAGYPALTLNLSKDFSNVVVGDIEGISGGSDSPVVNENITLEIYDSNGSLLDNVTNATDENGQVQYDYSHLPYGNYTYKAYHLDGDTLIQKEGNISIQTDLSVNVGYPSLTSTLAVESSVDGVVADSVPVVNENIRLEIYDSNGNLVDNVTNATDENGQVKYDYSSLPLGDYTYKAISSDGLTKEGPLSLSEVVGDNFSAIQAAIDSAEPGGVIFLQGKTYLNDIHGNMVIDKPITIIGTDGTVLDAEGISRIFEITGDADNVNLANMVLTNGHDDGYGGAIYINPGCDDGKFKNITFINNNASLGGGAVYNQGGQRWTVENSTFTNNSAYGETNHVPYGGGAIWSCNAEMTISNSTFVDNQAPYGGALRGAFDIFDSLFDNNTATDGNGGCIDVTTDASLYDSLILEFRNSTFINNDAKGNREDDRAQGGAIHIYHLQEVNMYDCYCENNTADRGGAVDFYELERTWVENCTFVNNNASSEGGGLAIFCNASTFKDSNVSNNNAGTDGGAIWVIGHNSLFDNVTSVNNTAERGGSSYVEGNYTTVINCNISNNTAIFNESKPDSSGLGGAMDIIGDHCQIINLTSDDNSAYRGGSTFVLGIDTTVRNSTFDNNNATISGGGLNIVGEGCEIYDVDVSNNHAGEDGGAIYVVGDNSLFDNVTSLNNTAEHGGSSFIAGDYVSVINCNLKNNNATYSGGGLDVSGSECLFENVSISDCHSFGDGWDDGGGAIYVLGDDNIFRNITSVNNTAINYGGSTFIGGYDTLIENCTISNNSAYNGGGIFIMGDDSKFIDNNITYNNAIETDEDHDFNIQGGGVFIYGAGSNFTNNNISSNHAKDSGGGVSVFFGPDTYFEDVYAFNNTAENGGFSNLLFCDGLTILNSTFYDNHATGDISLDRGEGGAFHLYGSENIDIQGNFSYNTATNGSAIYVEDSTLTVHDTTFFDNQAHSYYLLIVPEENSTFYNNEEVTITISHIGGDNIANAIHNRDAGSDVVLRNVTYPFYNNGTLINKTTPNEDIYPVIGYENSENGTKIYLDELEDNQVIYYEITNKDTNKSILIGFNRTEISGNVTIKLSNLEVGNYTVRAHYPETTYYTEIANETIFRIVDPCDLAINKTVSNHTSNVSDLVEWNVSTINYGPTDARNVTINDLLPDGLNLTNLTYSFYNASNVEWTNGTINLDDYVLRYGVYNATGGNWIYFNTQFNETTKSWTYSVLYLEDDVLIYEVFNESDFTDIFGDAIYDENGNSYNYRNISYNASTGIWSYYTFNYNGEDIVYGVFNESYFTGLFGDAYYDSDNATWIFVDEVYDAQSQTVVDKVTYYNVSGGHWIIGNETIVPTKVTLIPYAISLTLINDTESNKTNLTLRTSKLCLNESVLLTLVTNVTKEGNFTNIANVSTINQETNYTNNVADNYTATKIDLSIDKTVSNETCDVGDLVEWNVTAINNSPLDALNVTVNDFLPNGLNLTDLTYSFYNSTNGVWTNGSLNLSANALSYGVYNQSSDSWIYDYAVYDENTHTWTYYILNLNDNTLTYGEFSDSIFRDVFGESKYDGGSNSYNYRNISYNADTGIWSYHTFNYNGEDIIYGVFNESYFTSIFGTPTYDQTSNMWTFTLGEDSITNYDVSSGDWIIDGETITPTEVTLVPNKISLTLVNDTAKNQTNISLSAGHLDANGIVVLRLVTNVTEEGNFTNIANVTTVTPEYDYTNNVANNTTSTVKRTDLNVTKVWNDSDNQDGIRPANVTVHLYAGDVLINETVLNESNNWRATFSDLPISVNGVVINYTIREVFVHDDYIVNITNDTAYNWTVVNTYIPNVTDLNVTKVWNDSDNQDGIRPANVTVYLYAGDELINQTVLNKSNGWKATFSGLPVYAAGEVINYTIREVSVKGYDVVITNNTGYNWTVTNNHTHINKPNMTVEKIAYDEFVYVGNETSFTIFVKNTGDCDLDNIVVKESWFSDGLEYNDVWVSNGHHRWTYDKDNRTWTLVGVLNPEDFASFVVYFNVTQNGTLYNKVTAKSNLTNETNASDKTKAYLPNMTIQKIANDEIVYVGNTTSFTIVVTNTGDCDLEYVYVNDTEYSDGLIYSKYENGTRKWNIVDDLFVLDGVLAAGKNASLTVFFVVNDSGLLVNNATAGSNLTNETNGTNNTTAYSPNMTIQKIANNKAVKVGDITSFTIVVTNTGDCELGGIYVVDNDYSAGLDYIKYENGSREWTFNNNSMRWNLVGSLLTGESADFTIFFNVSTNGTLVNNATAGSNLTNETNGTNETESSPICDLVISKSVSTKEVNIGENVEWIIAVFNNGPSNATDVKVSDLIDSNSLLLVSAKASVGSFDNKTGIWTIGDLASGDTVTLTLVTKTLVEGIIENNVSGNTSTPESNYTNNNATNTTNVNPICDLIIVKTVDKSKVNVLDNVEWTITVSNNGPSTALDVLVKDILPEGLELISVNYDVGTFDNSTCEWSIGTIDKDLSVYLVLVTKVLANGTFINYASVNSSTPESNMTNNNASNSTKADSICDLIITKSVNCTNCIVGDYVEWNITVVNIGPSIASDVIVKDIMPKGLELVNYIVSVGNFNEVISEWSIGTLDKDASASLVLVTKVLIDGTIVNIATVNTTTPENNYTNNVVNNTTNADPICDLVIVKYVNASEVYIGDIIKWTIIVTNNGPSEAKNVKVSDNLPDGLIFVSYKSSQGKYNDDTGIWTVGKLASGSSARLTIVTNTSKVGNITNPVSVSTTTPESNESNNFANRTTQVNPLVDLIIKKSSDKLVYNINDTIHWIIKVKNKGPCEAIDVLVQDLLPSGTEFINYTSSKGFFNETEGVWSIGDLEKGEEVEIEIICKAIEYGKFTNYATVTNNVTELNLKDNSDNSTIEIIEENNTNPPVPHPKHVPVVMLKTGNPILVLLIVLFAIGGSIRFRNRKE